MKKIWIILIAILTLSVESIKADNSNCEATLTENKSFAVTFDIERAGTKFKRDGYMYVARLKNGNNSRMAFCLDRGKRAGTVYIRSTTRTVTVTDTMRRAYTFIQGHNSTSDEDTLYYIIGQLAIWLEQDIGNTNGLRSAAEQVYRGYRGNNYTSSDSEYIATLVEKFYSTQPYGGVMYTYESISNSENYQRFVSPINLNICSKDPGRVYCSSPNDNVDITDCVNQNQNQANPKQYCEQLHCSASTVCKGGVMSATVGQTAVCANDNSSHIGHYYEKVDYSQCGDADEDGDPTRPFGDASLAYLYCREEVKQVYPGGISSPISLGTSIVWPTSAATEHTVWKNLYSLSYVGTKICKVKMAPNTKSDKNPRETMQNLANEVDKGIQYDFVRTDYGSNCGLAYRSELESANNRLSSAKTNLANIQNALNNVNAECSKAQSCTPTTVDKNSGFRSACINRCTGDINSCRKDCEKYWPIELVQQSCDTSVCNGVAQYQSQLQRAQTAVTNAENQVKAVGNKVTACYTYLENYNKAIQYLNSIANLNTSGWAPEDLYHFESNTSISYNDPEYGASYTLKGTTTYQCTGCEAGNKITFDTNPRNLMRTYDRLVSQLTGREITITATATYSLPDNLYYYADKKTNKPLMNPTGNYITIGYSNLPTSYNAKVNQLYNLNIIVNSLGENGKFTELANANPYTCNYSVMNAPSDECVCPDGTEHAGEDLFPILYNASVTSAPMTCADAQLKYCNATVATYCPSDQTIDITSCLRTSSYEQCVSSLCPNGSGDKFCPNDRSIKITSCLNNGNSYDYCVNNLCGLSDDYHCPKGTFNDGMDIKPCVFANISMGLDNALQYCKDTVCPGGKRIIYRTISLRNPFPGKTAGAGVNHTTNLFSLDPHIGRYPGSNWNSQTLVKNQILFNRNVEGNAVYQKEPLYSFVLDTDTIKEIRKYNDKQEKVGGYADFTLECNSNGIACLSNQFLRESISGLVGGVCSSGSKSDFYGCAES